MSRAPKSSEALGIAEILHAQSDNIRQKRSLRISLAEYPSSTSLADICDTLSVILEQHSPPFQLETISLCDNMLKQLPAEFWWLCSSSLRTLDLHNNQLTAMPEKLASHCPNLENLDLSANAISHVTQAALSPFRCLKLLLLKDNKITHLPPILGEMSSLQTLVVSGNPLVYPKAEAVGAMHGGTGELKAYLMADSPLLDQNSQTPEPKSDPQAAGQRPTLASVPPLARTQLLQDTLSRSLKASRRMGLIINSKQVTPDKPFQGPVGDVNTPSKPARKLLLPTRERSESSAAVVSESSYYFLEKPASALLFTLPGPSEGTKDSELMTEAAAESRRDSEHSVDEHIEIDPEQGALFRRLSVLQETPAELVESRERVETKATGKAEVATKTQSKRKNTGIYVSSGRTYEKAVIVKVSRKILFSFSELHLSIKRFAGFCSDKKLSLKIVRLVHSSKEHIDDLVGGMESVEDGEDSQAYVLGSLHACIGSFKTILTAIGENFAALVAKIDTCFIRMVLLTLYGSLHELQNAHRLLTNAGNPGRARPSLARNTSSLNSSLADQKKQPALLEDLSLEAPSISSAAEAVATLEEIDERLYQTISLAASNAQVVFSELTKTISKSAMASATTKPSVVLEPAVAAKFKELTQVCMASMEITRRLVAKLGVIRESQDPPSRRSFWDDINLFLKAVIQTFSAVKDIMRDAPIFNEVRGSMANLTKTTKELTIILEASSYKAISDAVGLLPNNNMWHMSNGPPAVLSSASLSALPSALLSSAPPSLPPMAPLAMPPTPGVSASVRAPLAATVGTTAALVLMPIDTQHGHVTPSVNPYSMSLSSLPPLVATELFNGGLHTAPVQSMEQYHAKNVNPFDRI